MYYKYSEIMGLPIKCNDSKKTIAYMKDIIFYPIRKRIIAFLVEPAYFTLQKKVLLPHDIEEMQTDRITIKNAGKIKKLSELKKNYIVDDKRNLKGSRVKTKDGDEFGRVNDMLINLKTGGIEGVECTEGIVEDVYKGRKMIPLLYNVEFSEDCILVDKLAKDEVKEYGGISRIFHE